MPLLILITEDTRVILNGITCTVSINSNKEPVNIVMKFFITWKKLFVDRSYPFRDGRLVKYPVQNACAADAYGKKSSSLCVYVLLALFTAYR